MQTQSLEWATTELEERCVFPAAPMGADMAYEPQAKLLIRAFCRDDIYGHFQEGAFAMISGRSGQACGGLELLSLTGQSTKSRSSRIHG